jgi:hypothetical protein
LSLNLRRRSLNGSQKALVATHLMDWLSADAKKRMSQGAKGK